MAKGKQKYAEYQSALNQLGKELMRRSKRSCELSGESGTLVIYDLDEPKTDPDLTHIIHVSEEMKARLDGQSFNAGEVRCLESAIWSEHRAVRRAAVQLLSRVNESWAVEAIESAHMMNGGDEDEV